MAEDFKPDAGDHVEFDSDRQTEKGPSSGHVRSLSYFHDRCHIMHSDTKEPGEKFQTSAVKVLRKTTHHKTNKPLWILV